MAVRKKMEEPKKRLRGKQPVAAPDAYDAAEPKKRLRGKQKVAFPMASPKKRLRGKQKVASPTAPKLAKAKALVKKGEPKDQQFTDVLKKHFKENAGAINLAERVKKRQGKAPAVPKDPVDARDVFSKMPESVRKAPELSRKFREEILQVPMTGITSRENYAKLIAERERLMTNAIKENAGLEWQRLEAGAQRRGRDAMDRDRAEYLMGRYHNFDKDALSHGIPKPDAMIRGEAERMGAMIAEAMAAQGLGRGRRAGRRGDPPAA